MESETRPPAIVLVGPTASGKSALALMLASEFGGEIVTADSRQVYRYMDIGTDKPTAAERDRVPHYMIDLVDPNEAFTLADFQTGALDVLGKVATCGSVPILAGGTPLYVNAVVEGWTVPRVAPDTELRAALEAEARQSGSEMLHARLAQLDPVAAAQILPTNTRRVIRALEVTTLTGRPISEQQNRSAPPFSFLKLGLRLEREALYTRIDRRVDIQIESGLVDEVRSLHERGYAFDLPSMSGIGYRQIGDYLMGRATLAEAAQRIKWDTHAFARHQANWFRRATDTHWIDVTLESPREEALTFVSRLLNHDGNRRR